MNQEPVITEHRSISPIWILPAIALFICSWLLYSSFRDAGVEITIFFEDGTGVVAGKTQVMSRGLQVGLVKDIAPDIANKRIEATVEMDRSVADHLVEDTQFWVVRPRLSARAIEGLDTILSGSYIGIQFGSSTESRREYVGLTSAPPIPPDTPGLHLLLSAEKLGSIRIGTGIYYKNIEIGNVKSYELENDSSILIKIFIEPEFAHLVHEKSRFCNASGIEISGKLPNLKLKMESLASLLQGGILLYTPPALQHTPPAVNNQSYRLYTDYESANYGLPMTLALSSGENISEGVTKVMYRGLEAGFVKEISISKDAPWQVTAHILLDPRAEMILRETTKFWMVRPKISPKGIENLRLLLSGPYITFQPGDGEFRNNFKILPEPPPQIPLRPGKTFTLTSNAPSRITTNSQVYFKNVPVGEVIQVEVASSGRSLATTIFIYSEHLHLLSTESVFWVRSGIEVSADLEQGVHLTTSPFQTVINGGISFTTPDKLEKKKNFPPGDGFEFQLWDSYGEAVAAAPTLQRSGKTVRLLAQQAGSLSVGDPILYKNIKIGELKSFRLTGNHREIVFEGLIFREFSDIVGSRTRFFNASGVNLSAGLDGIELNTESLQTIVSGGVSCVNLEDAPPLPPASPYPLFASYSEALSADDMTITLAMDRTSGLREGAAVRYKGVKIGHVSALALDENRTGIIATARIKNNTRELFRKNTRIWVTGPEFSLDGIKNIDTVIPGPYLSLLPGDGPLERTFTLTQEVPHTVLANMDGLGIVLETPHLGSLSIGSPVYYREVEIGRIIGYELSPTFQKVHVFVTIAEPYRPVVRKNTKFWNVSGAKIEGGIFSGVKFSTGSMKTLIKGGVAMATPDNEQTGPPAVPGDHFPLYDKMDKKWLDWNPDVVVLEREQSRQLPAASSK
ncbi:MlaD family protein [Desulforhopalus singaporensis]|uniref:Paraquat-inducible protein B n=1 Tax=Desulforhopalus singaporensis TaxID=91360 RepID=A0A1H0S622_9BACT|nr:MlaD family protein [Desulforhopalus singaporensis]SDP37202.1 Paraquat-inducible protein B [Desulforhopalus singaporensis]